MLRITWYDLTGVSTAGLKREAPVRSAMDEINRVTYMDEETGNGGPRFAETRGLVTDLLGLAVEST
jgi:hypothetical protein